MRPKHPHVLNHISYFLHILSNVWTSTIVTRIKAYLGISFHSFRHLFSRRPWDRDIIFALVFATEIIGRPWSLELWKETCCSSTFCSWTNNSESSTFYPRILAWEHLINGHMLRFSRIVFLFSKIEFLLIFFTDGRTPKRGEMWAVVVHNMASNSTSIENCEPQQHSDSEVQSVWRDETSTPRPIFQPTEHGVRKKCCCSMIIDAYLHAYLHAYTGARAA